MSGSAVTAQQPGCAHGGCHVARCSLPCGAGAVAKPIGWPSSSTVTTPAGASGFITGLQHQWMSCRDQVSGKHELVQGLHSPKHKGTWVSITHRWWFWMYAPNT